MFLTRFIRTAPTRRLLAVIAGVIVAAGGGAAIAVAATSGGPVPPPSALAPAIHAALAGPKVAGITADITFTDNLIDSSDFTGQATDPLLQGASGRLWAAGDRLRIELQSGDGDSQIVVDGRSFWISDAARGVVYEGTLPADTGSSGPGSSDGSDPGVPSLTRIQDALTKLAGAADVSGAVATDVGGQPAYRVTLSPKTGGGLLGSVALAFDAAHGVPLEIDVDARGDSTPVLALQATSVSYGPVPASDFAISPPAGSRTVALGTLGGGDSGAAAAHTPEVTGVAAVSAQLDFPLAAPAQTAGLARTAVRLTGHAGSHGALVRYGSGPGAIVVLESADPSTGTSGGSSAGSPSAGGLSLPTRTIDGASATELSTPLGTVLHLTRDRVGVTVLGSVTAATAEQAARGLWP